MEYNQEREVACCHCSTICGNLKASSIGKSVSSCISFPSKYRKHRFDDRSQGLMEARNSSWNKTYGILFALLLILSGESNLFVTNAFTSSRNNRRTSKRRYQYPAVNTGSRFGKIHYRRIGQRLSLFSGCPRFRSRKGFNIDINCCSLRHTRQRTQHWTCVALHFDGSSSSGGQTNDGVSDLESSLGDITACPNGDLLSSECNAQIEFGENDENDRHLFSLYDGIISEKSSSDSNILADRTTIYPIPSPDGDDASGGTLGDIMSFPNYEDTKTSASQMASDTANSDKDHKNKRVTKAGDLSSMQRHNQDDAPKSGLVTAAGGTLKSHFGHKMGGRLSPLERIALTANGNLQRIFSSYYDAPVHVHVDFCKKRVQRNGSSTLQQATINKFNQQRDSNGKKVNVEGAFQQREWFCSGNEDMKKKEDENATVWDRRVLLIVHSKVFCTASSTVTVRDPACLALVESGKVGIGQLFRHLDILPTFELIDAGRIIETQQLWREYVLSCEEVTCRITEIFEPDAWSIEPPQPSTDFFH